MPFLEFIRRVRVIEAEHRFAETMRRKCARWLPSDPLRGRVGSNEFRMLFFKALELANQLIEFVIGNSRTIEDVVVVVVLANARPKILDLRRNGVHSAIVFI